MYFSVLPFKAELHMQSNIKHLGTGRPNSFITAGLVYVVNDHSVFKNLYLIKNYNGYNEIS